MTYIPRAFINEVITRCDLVELINIRVPLQKRGTNHTACCPFHSEKTPSFTVSSTKQLYHCFGCGVSGNAITFLMAYEQISFTQAVETIATHLGLCIPEDESTSSQHQPKKQTKLYTTLNAVMVFYVDQLYRPIGQKALEYLALRDINLEIAKEYQLGFAPSGWNNLLNMTVENKKNTDDPDPLLASGMLIKKNPQSHYARFRNRLMFPIRDIRGRVVGFGGRTLNDENPKYLNSPETVIFHKSHQLYGIYEAAKHLHNATYLIVVEGYIDVITLAQYGFRHVVATLGTSISLDHLRSLFRYHQNIIFCFDGDSAGKKAAWRALELALTQLSESRQTKFIFLPDGDDPDSLIRKEGVEKFRQRIEQAQSLSDFFFNQLNQFADMTTLEGKAYLLEFAKRLIKKMPQGSLQQLMLQKLAYFLQVEESMTSLVQKSDALLPLQNNFQLKSKKKNILNKNSGKVGNSPLRVAFALLLQNPSLAQHIKNGTDSLNSLNINGIRLFINLIEMLKKEPHLTTPAILENFRDTDEYKILIKLATWQHFVPVAGIEAEFLGALSCLIKLNHENIMELLMKKAAQNLLTKEEKIQLYKLIAAKHDKLPQSS